MKKILLTGATGFVGSHVARLLREAGHEVIAIVRTSSQDNYLRYLGIKLLYGSLEDPLLNKISQQIPGVDAVIHMAGIIKARKLSDFEKINTSGSANIYALAKKINVPRFVFVSSIAARGPNLPGLIESELKPVSVYGKSKRVAEDLLLQEKKGPKLVIMRPPVVYGPGDRETLTLFRYFEKGIFPVVGNGAKKISFVYVEDLAKILMQAVLSPQVGVGPYYPEDGSCGYSWHQVHQVAEKIYQKKIRKIKIPLTVAKIAVSFSELYSKLKKKAPMLSRDKYAEMKQDSWTCSVEPCLKELGYRQPLISLEEGLDRARQWYLEKGWL